GDEVELHLEIVIFEANDGDIDAVCRGTAHDAGDDHGSCFLMATASRRSSSLNSQSLRRSLSMDFCVGDLAVNFKCLNFFFSLSTWLAACETMAANFRSFSAVASTFS